MDEDRRPAARRSHRNRSSSIPGPRSPKPGTRRVSALRRAAGLARSLLVYHAIPGRQRKTPPPVPAVRGARRSGLRSRGPRRQPDAGVPRARTAASSHSIRNPTAPACCAPSSAGREAVTVVESAVGATDGRLQLTINERHPTLSTAADGWREERERDPRFANIRWNHTVTVACTTLDGLIARFGEPAFVKVDVEGSEPDVLAGLGQPLASLSFEYLPGALDAVRACVARLASLGRYRYNWSPGESFELAATRLADRRPAGRGPGDGRRPASLRRRLRPSGRRGGAGDDGALRSLPSCGATTTVTPQPSCATGRAAAPAPSTGRCGDRASRSREAAFHYVEDCIADRLRAALGGRRPSPRSSTSAAASAAVSAISPKRLPIRGAGVTLSPLQARLATERIRAAGLHDRIRCLEGDYADPGARAARRGPGRTPSSRSSTDPIRPASSPSARASSGRAACCSSATTSGAPAAALRPAAAIERFRRGWRINTLLDREADCAPLPQRRDSSTARRDDLTPFLETEPTARPRHRTARGAGRMAPGRCAKLGHLTGGNALRTCLRRGWIGYDLALFRRAGAPGHGRCLTTPSRTGSR